MHDHVKNEQDWWWEPYFWKLKEKTIILNKRALKTNLKVKTLVSWNDYQLPERKIVNEKIVFQAFPQVNYVTTKVKEKNPLSKRKITIKGNTQGIVTYPTKNWRIKAKTSGRPEGKS